GSITLETNDVQSGTQAAKVIVTTPGPNAYSIKIVSDNFSVTSGAVYKLKFWAKAAINAQSLRAVAQGTSYYAQQDQPLTTTWTPYTFNFTPTENSVSVKFHFPNTGTFLIDNLSVALSSTVPDPVLVDNALHTWITTMVDRYKGKVTGWDVVNEVVVDGTGDLRTSSNSSGSASDNFYWADYLGRNYIANAFRWANAADPSAKLFINDYNLESDNRKLDSVIKLINELKTAGVPIHGVGLQMHISINTNNAGIDNAFQKLAATGLLIHVSEMDVRMNPGNTTGFTATSTLHDQQAQKYKYVAQSYFQYVPVAQRFGITVWNLTDADSWIVLSGKEDFPTLFNSGYQKKAAFSGFVQGLK
ncbi:MAG TPA: endo-1,4-beta-xylanase, partial [Chitinophagaceae bacterium]|nr:endo-1,4-beta-xylanase [Chitinophagaceae bacterium]